MTDYTVRDLKVFFLNKYIDSDLHFSVGYDDNLSPIVIITVEDETIYFDTEEEEE